MRKGEETKDFIVRKSAELFNIRGYTACSLSDIMEETNLKKGGIYNHFKNKDEIAIAAFDYSYSLVFKRFKTRLSQDATSLDKIHSIIEVFQSFGTNPVVKGGCPIFNTAIDATGTHSDLKTKAKEAINTLIKYVEIKVEEGKIEGEFKMNVNAPEFALFLVSTLEGALMVSRVNEKQASLDMAADIIKTYVKNNLVK
ncbi:MAG: TetR/AcrR family transcriptional regulator [Salibacteraceae bacterium]